MRFDLGQKGIGGRDESWFYLVHDEAADDFFLVHEWSNMSGLRVIPGEERLPILEASGNRYYSDAVALIKSKFPDWKNISRL